MQLFYSRGFFLRYVHFLTSKAVRTSAHSALAAQPNGRQRPGSYGTCRASALSSPAPPRSADATPPSAPHSGERSEAGPPAPAAVLTGRARRSRRRRRGTRHRAAPSASSTAGPRMAAAVRPQPMAAAYRRRRPRPPRPFPRPAPSRAPAAGLRPSLIQTQRPGRPPAAGKGLPRISRARGEGAGEPRRFSSSFSSSSSSSGPRRPRG